MGCQMCTERGPETPIFSIVVASTCPGHDGMKDKYGNVVTHYYHEGGTLIDKVKPYRPEYLWAKYIDIARQALCGSSSQGLLYRVYHLGVLVATYVCAPTNSTDLMNFVTARQTEFRTKYGDDKDQIQILAQQLQHT